MNDSIAQFFNLLGGMPLSKKISMAVIFILLIAAFAFMFIWANQDSYQVLFNNLSPEDGGAIVSKLRERNIPYKIEANGSLIMVPAENVYDLRLALAGDGLPSGGNVGFEIFDKTDFRTSKFVQELNYRRALQGELARTINKFKKIKSSKVFIVLPKESLFIEDRKPASASIQLDLNSSLAPGKLAAIIHLVASAVEGLEPEQITVVDTRGRLIFKGRKEDETSALLSGSQLDYRVAVETGIRKNVQSMLEGIVGAGRAIVRVNAEIDFNKTTLNEVEYDSGETAIRSKRDILESYETLEGEGKTDESLINQRRGVVGAQPGARQSKTKKDVVTNYEINKITRTILKPAGNILHLSVAAVIDGTYQIETSADGTIKKNYIPRTEEELRKFEEIVKGAMGYSEDREDQVSVSSIPFSETISSVDIKTEEEGSEFDILRLLGNYKKVIVNLVLVVLVFLLIVRPLIKSLKQMTSESVLGRGGAPQIPGEGLEQITETGDVAGQSQRSTAVQLTQRDPDKTEQLIKGWIGEDDR
jgi:flagellar M-ring protein FliF